MGVKASSFSRGQPLHNFIAFTKQGSTILSSSALGYVGIPSSEIHDSTSDIGAVLITCKVDCSGLHVQDRPL